MEKRGDVDLALSDVMTLGFTGEIARNGNSDPADIEVLRKSYAIAELARAMREALS